MKKDPYSQPCAPPLMHAPDDPKFSDHFLVIDVFILLITPHLGCGFPPGHGPDSIRQEKPSRLITEVFHRKPRQLSPCIDIRRRSRPVRLDPRPRPLRSRDIDFIVLALLVVPQAPEEGTVKALQSQSIARPHKVQQTQTVLRLLVLGRDRYAMHATLQIPVGEDGQHIGDVDRHSAFRNPNPFPGGILVLLHLEGGDRLLEKERNRAVVSVATRIEVLELLVHLSWTGAVHHVAETAVAIRLVPMTVGDLVFGELEDDGEKLKQFVPDVLVDVAVEPFDLLPVPTEYFGMVALILRQELHDVVELNVVPQTREDLNGSQWPVAIVDALFEGCSVGPAYVFRQGEEFTSDRVVTIDLVLTEAEVGDVEETFSGEYQLGTLLVGKGITYPRCAPRLSTEPRVFLYPRVYRIHQDR